MDVRQGKVSAGAARDDYGVVLDEAGVDPAATAQLRERMRAACGEPACFDRGPGYERLRRELDQS